MVNRKRTTMPFRPVSSSNSRKTASSGFSPGSRAPPGNIQEVVPSRQRCFTRRISVPSVRTTAAAARGRSDVVFLLLFFLSLALSFRGRFLQLEISLPCFFQLGNVLLSDNVNRPYLSRIAAYLFTDHRYTTLGWHQIKEETMPNRRRSS